MTSIVATIGASAAEIAATTEAFARELAPTAAARDRAGGVPKAERDALRRSGLLTLAIPSQFGGHGASWPVIASAVRTIARVDGSLAHVFGFQHLLLATVRLFGTPAQFERWARATVERRWFWGNALNPLDDRARLGVVDDHFVLHGDKSYCSGAGDADVLVVSGIDERLGRLAVAVLPADRPGIVTHGDWQAMGQRQTDSGTVSFREVVVHGDELLRDPGPLGSTFATLRPCIAQLLLCNVYLGIAEGALAAGVDATQARTRPWVSSGVADVADDPYVLATLGELHAELVAAAAVTDAAAVALERAWSRADALTPDERGAAAIAIAAAKIVDTRAGLAVANGIFDATGARAAASSLGLDRHWRDLRTHTLHDPVDYKRRDVGRWLLTGAWPTPSFYA